MDIADACHERGVQTVAVTAGYMHDAPRREFYAKMDAANVDLKGVHRRVLLQDLRRRGCSRCSTRSSISGTRRSVWFEITTLLIPGKNDSDEELAGRVQVDHAATWGPTCRCTSPRSIPTGR